MSSGCVGGSANILKAMHEFSIDNNKRELTVSNIQSVLDLSETSIRKNLSKLVKAGYVVRHERRNSKGWRFTVFTIDEDLIDFVEVILLGGY